MYYVTIDADEGWIEVGPDPLDEAYDCYRQVMQETGENVLPFDLWKDEIRKSLAREAA